MLRVDEYKTSCISQIKQDDESREKSLTFSIEKCRVAEGFTCWADVAEEKDQLHITRTAAPDPTRQRITHSARHQE